MNPKRRVLVVNQYAFPREYGGITRNFDLFSRLRGWLFRIVTTSRNHYSGEVMKVDDDRFIMTSIPAYHGNGAMRLIGWFVFAGQATIHALRNRVDLYFGSSPHLLAPVVAMVAAKLRRVPWVMEVRDLWPESLVTAGALRRNSLLHKVLVGIERMLYRSASEIVVVTDGWEDHFESLGIDLEKITVIGNGADVDDYDVLESKETLRERYGIRGFTAVFAGNHSPYVGLETILAAATKLPDVQFLLLGNGSRKQWAVDQAQRLGLTNIEFREPIGKPELPSLLKACDVGLHTIAPQSVFDKGMSPNKLFDYMASGIPSVSNARVPLSRVIVDDQVGAVTDPEELAEGIARVKDASAKTRARWIDEGRKLMQERFSLAASASKLERVLDRALSRRGSLEDTRL